MKQAMGAWSQVPTLWVKAHRLIEEFKSGRHLAFVLQDQSKILEYLRQVHRLPCDSIVRGAQFEAVLRSVC
jgi:hypothetical protein